MEIIPEIKGIARAYFQKLFTLEGRGNLDQVLPKVGRCISEEDNQLLMASYTKDEIKAAMFEMGPIKAPGDDGLLTLFYQKCWHIVGEDVINFCLQTLNKDKDFKQINSTNIVLIPKVADPVNMMQFRPISLCNVIYKIMAKFIANRLRGVIGKCIDVAQSAFVPGRLISDNILLAYEILHTLKWKRVGQKGFMVVKLDMSKAYDRVEWKFIEEIMIRMGFASNWIETIMKCINSVTYSIIVNGFEGENFQPTRGLRQGDPLSPFMFLICREGLSCLINRAMSEGLLKGVKASRSGPQWIPRIDTVVRSHENNNEVQLVSDIIDATNNMWKSELVLSTFLADTAQKILQIPLAELLGVDFQRFWDWLTWMFQKSTPKQGRLLCCGILVLWGSRNKLMHERKVESVREIASKFQRYLAEIDGLVEKRSTLFTATRAIQSDTSSGMTIHFDAAFNRRDFKSMAGLVVRDQMGVILATKTILNSNVSTSFAAEAYAGLHSINLGLSMGIHSVTVKGDSRTVIKKCQTSMQDKSIIGAIISDIQKKSRVFSRNQVPIYQ
ncbi:hypothetical protein PVK06_034740 [Gossypium arboreum]|uniref:Reverse transcriptase domain-containing protein n=1 Tax=Gossypium arboreum TaxID=29729 RepID=A0ABR0NF00_GOSAR|nr:hypothetical protein PVK06_034740 [Gossypium arboreum]